MSQLGDDVALAFREAVAQRERAEKAEAELARVTAEAAQLRQALGNVVNGVWGCDMTQVAQEALSSTSAGAGLLKRLEVASRLADLYVEEYPGSRAADEWRSAKEEAP